MSFVKRFEPNTKGRDLIVGDIHGHFTKLWGALAEVDFNPDRGDRLFSVGDLVDRGPESALALDWLDQPWFHAVMGNHEDMACMWAAGGLDAQMYAMNGGAWNIAQQGYQRHAVACAFQELPIAIELETSAGLVGIVHADCPRAVWQDFVGQLQAIEHALAAGIEPAMEEQGLLSAALWSRDRFNSDFGGEVAGVRAVVVGHTPMEAMSSLGNVIYIDTGAWLPEARFPGKRFTIIDAATLSPAYAPVLDFAG